MSCYRYTHTSPHIYYSPPKHPCLFHFIDCLCALSCLLISCSASGCCLFHKSCLSGSAGDATPSLLSWIMYFIYSPSSFYRSVWGHEEKAFYKTINANLISAHPPPPHQSQLQRGHKDGEGDNQLIWSSALGNGERKRSWGTDIHLLGMIELRRERELERREGWRNEVVWVTEDEGARAWEMQWVCVLDMRVWKIEMQRMKYCKIVWWKTDGVIGGTAM